MEMMPHKQQEDTLIWVDGQDREIGYGEKMDTHIRGQLHRAFSLFVFSKDTGRLLLHQRAPGKYHSGGLWTNSCCSHPRRGEQLRDAVVRRSAEELGLVLDKEAVCRLKEVGIFQYFHQFETVAEHEIDHVFLYESDCEPQPLNPDPEEIGALRWVTLPELDEWMKERPEEFTPWFLPALQLIRKALSDRTE